MEELNKYEQKFIDFIRGITKQDKIALFHDVDGDGIPAAAITINALKRLGLKVDMVIGKGREELTPSEETIKQLKDGKITVLITLDKPTDKNPKAIIEISKFAKILVVDHHSREAQIDIDDKKVLIFKPQFFTNHPPAPYATAKIVFDYFSKIVDITDLDWIACAGTMSDAGDVYWRDFIKQIQSKYGFEGDDPWKTDLEKVVGYMSHTECYKKGYYTKALSALAKSKSPKDFLKSDVKKYFDAVNKEVTSYIQNVKKNAEFKDDLIYYEINPKYNIKTIVSTVLSIRFYPDKTLIVVVNNDNPKLSISFRRHDGKKDMVKLSKESLKGLTDAVPGGHIPAAGGSVWKEKLGDFKRKVIELNSSGIADIKQA